MFTILSQLVLLPENYFEEKHSYKNYKLVQLVHFCKHCLYFLHCP